MQDDLLNDSLLGTVMVVPLTTNLQRAVAVGNVSLRTQDTGLARPSVALVCQVVAIDKGVLTELVGSLPKRAIANIDEGLRLVLGLMG